MKSDKEFTRTASFFLDKNNILHIETFKDIYVDLEDAQENHEVICKLTNDKPIYKLFYAEHFWAMSKSAQKFIASKDVLENTIARAVIKNEHANRDMLEFLNEISKPTSRTRLCG